MAGRRVFSYRRNLIERTVIRDESFGLIDLPDSVFFLYALLAPLALMKHVSACVRGGAAPNTGNAKRDSARRLSTTALPEGTEDRSEI